MTTTTERLLQLAAEHEEKARALRLAAAELNGHQMDAAKARSATTLAAAISLRKQQRAGRENREDTEERCEALVRASLAEGPQSTKQLAAYLAAHGINRSRYALGQMLRRLGRRTGATTSTRWHLRTRRRRSPGSSATPPGKDAAAE